MSVGFKALGHMLFDKYVIDFVAAMQGVSPLGGMMSWHTVTEDTNFGKLLHKEGLWSLYQYREEKSLLYHLCRHTYGRFELNNNPCNPKDGKCIDCSETAPEEIHGLWKLHNFEWIQQSGGADV